MAIKATGRATFTAVEDYDIVFVLNGIRCDVLNFDSVRTAESATLEADFYNGGTSCVVDKAVLCCYDGEGSVLGTPIEVHDTSSAVADGGSLYLSKDCKTITCDIYVGDKKLCSKGIPVIRNGSSVGVKAVSYKVINNVDSGASLNWDSVQSQTTYPTQKPDKGKYCYVMTIVLYTDGTSTNTVSTSYTPNDGKDVTTSVSVTYARSTTNVQPSDFPLTAVPSDLALGEYLWSKTVVTYTGANTKTTTSIAVSRVGKDGAVGYSLHMLYSNVEKPTLNSQIATSMQKGYDYIYVYSDQSTTDDVSKGIGQTFKKIKGDQGIPGNDGHTPTITIGANGNWYIDNKDSGQKAQGNDGHTPTVTIGTDGYWYIDGVKTSQKAQGDPGAPGADAVSYRLVRMADTAATVKASGSSTSATFSLVYKLHYKAVKMIGARTEDAKIATIAATIEGAVKTTTVNNTEGTLSGNGVQSYTSDNRPADAIPVTVTLSDGTVLYDNVKVTMEAGVAIDINKNLATVTTTLANQSGDINSIRSTANSNSARISDHDGRLSTVEQTASSISLKVKSLQSMAKSRNLLSGGNVTGLYNKQYRVFLSSAFKMEQGKIYTVTARLWLESASNGHFAFAYVFGADGDWTYTYPSGRYGNTSGSVVRFRFTAGTSKQMVVGIYEKDANDKDPGSGNYNGVHVDWVRVDEGDWTGLDAKGNTDPNGRTLDAWTPSEEETDALNLLPDPSFSANSNLQASYSDTLGSRSCTDTSLVQEKVYSDSINCVELKRSGSTGNHYEGLTYIVPFRGAGSYTISYAWKNLNMTDNTKTALDNKVVMLLAFLDSNGNTIDEWGCWDTNSSACYGFNYVNRTISIPSGGVTDISKVASMRVRIAILGNGDVAFGAICLSKSDHYIYWNANEVSEERKKEAAQLATGIDIESHKITLTADKTVVRSNNGTQIALFGMSPNGVPFLNTNLINAESITVNRFMAFNDSTMLTSINYNGCGEFIQYYPDGKKKMEIVDGNIIYYNDDAKNSTKWVIGENGTSQSIDSWSVFQLCKTDSDGSNVQTTSTLSGETYSEFRAGANSINTKYNGLTVSGRQTGTSPTALGITKIKDGWYTNTAAAFVMSNQNSYGNATGFPTASRMLYEYKDGYKTGNMKTIKWLVQAENTIA